jgi:S-adenosylmethionine decarboxylase proenzyme
LIYSTATEKDPAELNVKPDATVVNLGRHLLAEFYDCNSNILNNVQMVEDIMTEAAIACGATVVQKDFHHFSPFGVSGVVVIAESHLAIHTWPEYGYAAVDLFTCGSSCDPQVAYEYLKDKLGSGSAFFSQLKRGLLNTETNKMIESPFCIEAQMSTVTAGAEIIGSQPIENTALPAMMTPEVVMAQEVMEGSQG